MKKAFSIIVLISILLSLTAGTNFYEYADGSAISESINIKNPHLHPNDNSSLASTFSKYTSHATSKEVSNINLPWISQQSQILEWWIQIKYNDEIFKKQIPVNITDFKDKFLKHPEYGEKIAFDIDEDPENDVEVIAGFYWSVIKNEQGEYIKSLENRIRFRQLSTGNYIQDSNKDLEVWSELHVNLGIIKKNTHVHPIIRVIQDQFQKFPKLLFRLQELADRLPFFRQLLFGSTSNENKKKFSSDDSGHIVVGTGYRSPAGQEIPRFVEKRFAFARNNLFDPTIFQHHMDPGSSKGKGPFDVLYGFKTYHPGASNPAYNIEFSINFNPAVYLKTKFVPVNGYIYYYYDETSQQNTETSITFTSNSAGGVAEDVELTLIFDEIDETLGQLGRWMKFDVDVVGDNNLLGGKFQYEASHIFNIGVNVKSPLFEEKIELIHLPKKINISWDLNFSLNPSPVLFAHAEGFINLAMSSSLGRIVVYYPKKDSLSSDQIFLDIPSGIPEKIRIDAAVTLNLDVSNMKNPGNYVYGNIQHTCTNNIECIQAFLPEEKTPAIKVSEIPAKSEAEGKLNWNNLKGYAKMWRGSHGPADPVEINIGYKGFLIHDILTIRDGHISTRFKLGDNGHFFFDTTEGIFGNVLCVSNNESGDALALSVDEISADKLQADWNIDSSGESLKINDIHFEGMLDVMRGLQLDLQYQEKTASLNLDWIIGKTGHFQIQLFQEEDLILDFSDFALNNTEFDFDGSITLSDIIQFDMSWDLKQGTGSEQGSVDPGFFAINKNNSEEFVKDFNFYLTYQDKYGVDISFSNLQFYFNLEWWKGERLLPYIWLDYEISCDDFDVNLLWTNANQETRWYKNLEEM